VRIDLVKVEVQADSTCPLFYNINGIKIIKMAIKLLD